MIAQPRRWRWANFLPGEFACKHCGAHGMGVGTMDRLQELRTAWGFPMHVNSGYRCPKHPVEAGKARLGAHVYGHAADIAMPDPAQKYAFIALAMEHGFTGIGVAAHYVHLDDVAPGEIARIVRPARWTYPA